MRNCLLAILILYTSVSGAQSIAKLIVPVGHKAAVKNCYFSPNDQYLVSADEEHGLCIWDGNDGRQLYKLSDTSGHFNKVAFNPGSTLLAAISDSTLYLLDFLKLKILYTVNRVGDFSFSPDGSHLFMIVNDNEVRSVSNTGKVSSYMIKTPSYITKTPITNILSLSNNQVLIQEDSHTISLIDLSSSKKQAVLSTPYKAIYLLDADPLKKTLLAGSIESQKGIVFTMDLVTKKPVKKWQLPSDQTIITINGSYTANADRILVQYKTVDVDGFMYSFKGPYVYSWGSGKIVQAIEPNDEEFHFKELKEYNLNYSKNSITSERNLQGSSQSIIQHINLSENKGTGIFINEKEELLYAFASANRSDKFAIFRTDLLLPLILNDQAIENKTADEIFEKGIHSKILQLDMMQSRLGNNGGLKGISINEKAIDDSTIYFEGITTDTSNNKFGYFLRKSENADDSFYFNFDNVLSPVRDAQRFYWNFHDSDHVFDIKNFTELRDSASVSKAQTYLYGHILRPIIDKDYSHLIDGYSPSDWLVTDIDEARGITWEYPFRANTVDSVMILDSTGELAGMQVVKKLPFLRIKKSTEEYGTDIMDKLADPEEEICQVRYWKNDSYAILSKAGRVYIYNTKLDSVTRNFTCTKGNNTRLYIPDSTLILVSNEEKNETSFIDPESKKQSSVTGYFNPDIRQRDEVIILQDGSFGNYYFYSRKDNQFLCTVNLFDRNDFVVYTANGLFDGTEAAMEKIYFLVNDPQSRDQPWKTIDLKQLKAKYYTPSLLDKLLSGNTDDLPDLESMSTVKLAPEILTDTSCSLIKPFRFTVTDKGGGIGPVRVVINGKEVMTDARSLAKKEGSRYSFSLDLRPYRSYFREKKNSIQVFAMNIDSSISSRGVITSSVEKQDGLSAAPRLFMISIGTSDYKGNEIDLQYSSKDAIDMAEAMKLGGARLFGADSVTIITLSSNTTDSSLLPSKPNIQKAFQLVAGKARAKDILFVYLSGHGINSGNDFHYLTRDAWSANASTYVYKELLSNVSVSSTEFTEYLKKIPALKQLFVIDACASGKLVENLIAHRDIPVSTLKALDRMKDRTGTHVITGCAADAVSYEASRFGQGLLTYSLLEGMKGASLREDKFLDVSQWFQYARDRVPQLANGLGGIQTPQVCSPLNNESFDVAELDESEKMKVPLAREKPVFIRSQFQEQEQFVDQLQIGKKLDILLNETSAKGSESSFLYIPVDEFPDAYQVVGRYQVKEGTISARIKLVTGSGRKLIKEWEISAGSPAELVSLISEKINKFQ